MDVDISTLKTIPWNFTKGFVVSFCKGFWAIAVGLFCILFEIDKEEAQRNVRLDRARNESATPKTASPGSHVLRNRYKQRQEQLLKELETDSSLSPENKQEALIGTKLSQFKDAIKRHGVYYLSKNRFTLVLCIFYNMVIGFALFLTTRLIPESDHVVARMLRPFVGAFLGVIFHVIQCILRIFTAVEFSDVNNAAANYRDTMGMPKRNFKQLNAFTTTAADTVVSIFTLFLIDLLITVFLEWIPFEAARVVLIYIGHCLYHACYAYDYRYMSEGLTQRARFRRIERNWSFYVGFGFPLAIVTFFSPDPTIARCVANACYPVLIVSAYLSEPEDDTEGVPSIPAFIIPVTLSENLVTWFSKWCLQRMLSGDSTTTPTVQN